MQLQILNAQEYLKKGPQEKITVLLFELRMSE